MLNGVTFGSILVIKPIAITNRMKISMPIHHLVLSCQAGSKTKRILDIPKPICHLGIMHPFDIKLIQNIWESFVTCVNAVAL